MIFARLKKKQMLLFNNSYCIIILCSSTLENIVRFDELVFTEYICLWRLLNIEIQVTVVKMWRQNKKRKFQVKMRTRSGETEQNWEHAQVQFLAVHALYLSVILEALTQWPVALSSSAQQGQLTFSWTLHSTNWLSFTWVASDFLEHCLRALPKNADMFYWRYF